MSPRVIEGPYLAGVRDVPRALREAVLALAGSPELNTLAERLAAGDFRHVVLTGTGSSFHALHPLPLELIACGVPARPV